MVNPMKIFDYYSGFEGEPEIRILQKSKEGENISVLKIWEAYFRAIIELIKPNDNGCWEGVSLQYHLGTGWYDVGYWECDNVALFLEQLESIDENNLEYGKTETIESVSHDVLKLLKTMLRNTIELDGKIMIEYD